MLLIKAYPERSGCALMIRQLMVPQAERLSKLEHESSGDLPRYLPAFRRGGRSFTV
jgi:hypothetical protein